VLIARGKSVPSKERWRVLIGIFVGDLLLIRRGPAGRILRVAVGALARFLSRHKLSKAADWFAERGLAVVFLSRFTPDCDCPRTSPPDILRTRFWSFDGILSNRRGGVDTAAGRRHRAFG
jgi:hypothetical protein